MLNSRFALNKSKPLLMIHPYLSKPPIYKSRVSFSGYSDQPRPPGILRQ
ncbi:unnamed protein product, partial [Vitis vinifera]|uniref:Uncharacterized protein n=1 Tax=Vitis vinifera TaxID=29760 RepID=D7TY29_VITVI